MMTTLVHERMLIGAIDSFLSMIVHVRPHLATTYRDQLERFAAYWIDEGHPNQLDAVDDDSLLFYLQMAATPASAAGVLYEFFGWAAHEGLIESADHTYTTN